MTKNRKRNCVQISAFLDLGCPVFVELLYLTDRMNIIYTDSIKNALYICEFEYSFNIEPKTIEFDFLHKLMNSKCLKTGLVKNLDIPKIEKAIGLLSGFWAFV